MEDTRIPKQILNTNQEGEETMGYQRDDGYSEAGIGHLPNLWSEEEEDIYMQNNKEKYISHWVSQSIQ